jgi:predicted nucleotidyltransferase
MANIEKILDSLSIQETLNPKIWDHPDDLKKTTLKAKVRRGLLKVAKVFIDELSDNLPVEDIYLMGSLANYNWSEFSDFDLHVLIDFKKYGKEEKIYEELFDLKKKLFNMQHDIKIVGFEVEVYAQPTTLESHSDGTYSLLYNKWISKPKKTTKNIDKNLLKKKISSWTDKIDAGLETAKKDGNVEILKKLKDKIKDYRQIGLRKEGEYSYENLVFKYLRRSGHIGKLFDTKGKLTDKKLSVEAKVS